MDKFRIRCTGVFDRGGVPEAVIVAERSDRRRYVFVRSYELEIFGMAAAVAHVDTFNAGSRTDDGRPAFVPPDLIRVDGKASVDPMHFVPSPAWKCEAFAGWHDVEFALRLFARLEKGWACERPGVALPCCVAYLGRRLQIAGDS